MRGAMTKGLYLMSQEWDSLGFSDSVAVNSQSLVLTCRSAVVQTLLHSRRIIQIRTGAAASSRLQVNLLGFCSLTHLVLLFPLLPSHFTTFSFAADPSSPSDFLLTLWDFYFPLIFSSSPSLLYHALLWLIYAITLSPSIRVLSLFWRLVNSQLMINQILITACWKPHSLSWCMVMIVPPLLLESQQTHSFIFFFFLCPPCFPLCLPSLCKPFSFHFVLEVVWSHPPMKHAVICIFAHAHKNTYNCLSWQPMIKLTNILKHDYYFASHQETWGSHWLLTSVVQTCCRESSMATCRAKVCDGLFPSRSLLFSLQTGRA